MISQERLTIAQLNFHFTIGLHIAGNHFCPWPQLDYIVHDAGFQPGLDLQPSLSPHSPADSILRFLRQPAEPSWILNHRLHKFANPGPVGRLEGRRFMPVRDMNGRSPGFMKKRGPLKRTLSPANNQAPFTFQICKIDQVTRV